MSRIGKLPVRIPQGVDVSIKGNEITVKGPRGCMSRQISPLISASVEDGHLYFSRPNDEKQTKALHGLYRALVHNMVVGVSDGFTIVQEVIGVGYKVKATGHVLELDLGYSHKIFFELPDEVSVETVTEKGKNPVITLTSIDKELLGQVAAKIRSMRKPEPYKGKGIRFKGEEVRKKAGKAAAK